jgi:DNA ligase-1
MISHDEFYSKRGESNKPFGLRFNNLMVTLKRNSTPYLSAVNQERIKNDEHFAEWCVEASQSGWEGLMLRADEPYKGKRSKDLLKYKSFFDDEYTVIDTKMGPFRYVKDGQEVEETMLSNVTISHKGYNVDVGSGFTIEERQAFFKNPNLILGKTITVQYFEETKNQQGTISLRFPTFKVLHGEERDI